LVDSVESMMTHGLANPQKKINTRNMSVEQTADCRKTRLSLV